MFLDIWLQGSKLDGLQLLDVIKQRAPELPVVMISGHGNIETAVAAIKHGAYDFIEKPFKADRLVLVADRALETRGSSARSSSSSSSRRIPVDAGRPLDRDRAIAPVDRTGGADQQPRPDRRSLRRGQGTGGAHDSSDVGTRRADPSS